jgi:TonB family protein
MVGAVVVFGGLLVNVTAQSPAPLPTVAWPSVEAIAPAPLPPARSSGSPATVVRAPAPAEPSLTPASRATEAPSLAVGGIKGEVRDEDGGTIPGARVSVRTTNGVAIGSVVTDALGWFAFPNLPADVYEITVSLQGFRTWRARLSVAEGEATPAGVRLQLGTMSEVVNVSAPASMVVASVNQVVPTEQNRTTAPSASDAVRALMPEQTGPIRAGGDIKEPKRVNYVAPEYSADAIARGVTGIVIIEAVVSASGAVTDPKIIRGQPLLSEAALAAVAQWRYTPVLLNGVPRAITLSVVVNFSAR